MPEGNLVIKERQLKWANERNLKLVAGGSDESDTVYVTDVTENLFMRLNTESIDDYTKALGAPLKAKGGQLPHLHSLTSSDAITVNVFDYLRRGRLALVAECPEFRQTTSYRSTLSDNSSLCRELWAGQMSTLCSATRQRHLCIWLCGV